MANSMQGEKVAKRKGYILLKEIPKLEDIIENWDKFEDEFYVAEYNYHLKDFKFYLRKYITGIMRIWVYNYEIVVKRKGDEIDITFDDVNKIEDIHIAFILNRIFEEFLSFWIKYVDIKINMGERKFSINTFPRRVNAIINAKFKLTNDEREIANSINFSRIQINGKYLALLKINNKGRKYYVTRFGKLPTPLRIAIRNRKISYSILKMLLNKKIAEREEFKILPETILKDRLKLSDIIYIQYFLSPVYKFNRERLSLQGIRRIQNFTVVDYDYDNVNQIIFKIITFGVDDIAFSALCGIDYKNEMWCIRISNFMRYWKIKSLYKYVYQLDENTKIFEF
ncbi:hypothetical protein AFV6_gp25 [Betalipothrixvirus pozzuoliense]|uniref:Uncharacterized protein n=1 Tax=Betalipothrixvirus pozzuoliense TaxID=346882 RepID=A7WKH9_9VIRU|nr:hypothetical protein AFV6_gp25 [Acidianus filamentous virus 6]CAJ31579.1 conserved hypothetical protein [Acidianus filamentous virus 6]